MRCWPLAGLGAASGALLYPPPPAIITSFHLLLTAVRHYFVKRKKKPGFCITANIIVGSLDVCTELSREQESFAAVSSCTFPAAERVACECRPTSTTPWLHTPPKAPEIAVDLVLASKYKRHTTSRSIFPFSLPPSLSEVGRSRGIIRYVGVE